MPDLSDRLRLSHDGKTRITLDPARAPMVDIGPGGDGGRLVYTYESYRPVLRIEEHDDLGLIEMTTSRWSDPPERAVVLGGHECELSLGWSRRAGLVRVRNTAGQVTASLDGATGRLHTTGGDCAERFPVVDPTACEPGMVMVLGEDGMSPCDQAYDRRVAGVISGAGGLEPGVELAAGNQEGHVPLALTGRVFCWVDADEAPVALGDLLTSAPRRGHAMRAADRDRAFGSILGKAMAPLATGRALIPVLVTIG